MHEAMMECENYDEINATKFEFLLKANGILSEVYGPPLNSMWAFKFKLSEEIGKVLILTKVVKGLKVVTEVFELLDELQ